MDNKRLTEKIEELKDVFIEEFGEDCEGHLSIAIFPDGSFFGFVLGNNNKNIYQYKSWEVNDDEKDIID